jgi:hypothetical protein
MVSRSNTSEISSDDADSRRAAPAVARNTAPILEVLRGVLPERGLVLEVASGTGVCYLGSLNQHVMMGDLDLQRAGAHAASNCRVPGCLALGMK